LEKLPRIEDPRLLVGISTADDAGVFKLTDELALIQTVDFFTPILDDPYLYGQISAANSLSDVYAMGGTPITALNIAGVSTGYFDADTLAAIFRGGIDKATEAGVVVLGGHTISDKELKYGLSVTGLIHPDRIITNSQAKIGDVLILTKPIGTGIVTTALKQAKLTEEELGITIQSMTTLNKFAAEAMQKIGVHAATDVTGFGLLGHLHELLAASGVGAEVFAHSIPFVPGALKYAKIGTIPAGSRANQFYLDDDEKVQLVADIPEEHEVLLYDAQTSGGLIIAVPPEKADALLQAIRETDHPFEPVIIGRIIEANPGFIRIVD